MKNPESTNFQPCLCRCRIYDSNETGLKNDANEASVFLFSHAELTDVNYCLNLFFSLCIEKKIGIPSGLINFCMIIG